MTWEELIEKLKDTNIDLTNEFNINEYSDISKKETQNEFENFGLTPDILFAKAIDGLISNYINIKIFKNININFETNPLEAIVYRKTYENIEDIKKEFISLFNNEDELIDFLERINYEK